MEGIRLRLLFKDSNILSDLQKSEGLEQSWFFLKPQLYKSINDLSSYLFHKFQLHGSCPYGIYLSMDGFVLPPFESTCILKDKDIISVSKKGGHLVVKGNNGPEMILAVKGNNGPNVVEKIQMVEKQPVIGGPLLLANEEFGHGSGGSDSEDESEKEEKAEPKEDASHKKNALGGKAISKKRKAPETLPSSKKKKHHYDAEEKLDEQTNKQNLTNEKSQNKKQNVSDPNNEDMENDEGSDESSEDTHVTPSMEKKKKHRYDAEEKLDEQTKKQDLTSKKSYHKKPNASDPNNEDMENDDGSDASSEDTHVTPSMDKNCELQKNGVENVEATPNSGATKKKGSSRNARRKAKRRRWLREMAKIMEKNAITDSEGLRNWKELQAKAGKGEPSCQPNGRVNDEANNQPKVQQNWKQQNTKAKEEEVAGRSKGLLQWKQFQGEDKNKESNQEKPAEEKGKLCGETCENSDTEDEVVPVEIRPGHIRFEPLGKERVPQPSQVEPESFRFNGNISKRKGQKWGQEKGSFSQKNDSQYSNKEHPLMVNGERQEWGREEVSFSHTIDSIDSNKEHPEMVDGEKEPHFHESIDFNKLPYLSGLPKEGHVIAYKLLELSSSWTPQISAYRVGKISLYDSEANRVFLIPVAEFPLILTEDESSEQPDNCIYNEDGSLEIDFSSLLEARLVKDGTPGPVGTPGRVIEHSAANESTPVLGSSNKNTETPAAGAGEVNNGKQKTQSTPSENGGGNPWDQFSDTLKAKRAELSKESSCDKKEISGRSSWSYRSMRGSALGPTMAFLRSQKEI